MTPEEKSQELIDKFKSEIGCSDFHIPKFISGVKCADGSKEYEKVLEDETTLLAKQCAIICVDEIMDENSANNVSNDCAWVNNPETGKYDITNEQFWESVKQAIQNA